METNENLVIRKAVKFKTSSEHFTFPKKCVYCCNNSTTSYFIDTKTLVHPGGGYKPIEIKRKFYIPICEKHSKLPDAQNSALFTFAISFGMPFLYLLIYLMFFKNNKNQDIFNIIGGIAGGIFILGSLISVLLYFINVKKIKGKYPEFKKHFTTQPVSIEIFGDCDPVLNIHSPVNIYIRNVYIRFNNHMYANYFKELNNSVIEK
jgi:hypothetical protein